MTIRFIEDPEVQQAIEAAARAACEGLDETFPGHDAGGITSDFHGLLVDAIAKMLTGQSLPGLRSHSTVLPKLVLDESAFGNPLARGEMFVVTRQGEPYWHKEADPAHPDGARLKQVTDTLALSDGGKRFVPLTDGERINPFTSYEAAVQAAVQYLKSAGETLATAPLQVHPVAFAEPGFKLVTGPARH